MRKWILRSLIALLLLLAFAAAGFVYYLRRNYSPEKIRAELERALTQRSGFSVEIGELDFTYLGDIRLRKICIRNADIEGARCFVSADIASLDLAILPLLKKRVEIRGIDIAQAQVAFFTGKSVLPAAKGATVRSWEAPRGSNAAGDSQATQRFSLQSINIARGEIFHEAQALPFPLGKTDFSAQLRAGDTQQVTSKFVFPDKGKIELKFQGKAGNLVATARSLLSHNRFESDDAFEGTFDCSALSLSPVDPRLRSVTGIFTVGIRANTVHLKTASAQIQIFKPIPLAFGYSGEFDLGLPQMGVVQGSGTISGQGFYATFNNFAHASKTGTSGNLAVSIELGKLREGATGKLTAHGVLQAGKFSGGFAVKDFSLPMATHSLGSAAFSGQLNGDHAIITKQQFNLDGVPFTGSFTINRSGTQTDIQASVDKLTYQKWELSNVNARLIATPEKLRLENGNATIARGRLGFSYTVSARDQLQNLRLSLTGAKAQDLSPMLGLAGKIFGDVSLDATLSATGALTERKNLTGPITFRIGRGKIKDSFFQKGILTGPLHKLEEKFSDIEFISGSADTTLSQGALTIRKLYFDAEEWSVTLRAESDKDFTGKAALDFRFRESFIANVANPLHLGIEGRKEGEFYDLPFACRGNITSGSCYQKNW